MWLRNLIMRSLVYSHRLAYLFISLISAAPAAGLEDAPHWSFVAPERPQPNARDQAATARSTIDLFVRDRLQPTGLRPSPEAPRHTLIRRLSIDLLGLLPTPERVGRFIRDDSPNAYEKLVDEMLASPHFGERWGRHWLDLARYADSFGYERDDVRPNAWRYRDWVIRSINANQPYHQFIIEQVAGDLLPEATTEQRVATGERDLFTVDHETHCRAF